jgi:purine-binding chemotaxis protein CheW
MSTHKTTPQKTNKAIDWREVERRLEAARVAIECIWAPTVADTQRILKKRAQALNREAMPAASMPDLTGV